MAFTIQNWGRISTTANEPIVTLTSGTIVGTQRHFSYYSPIDTQATVSAANYFNTVFQELSVGDLIQVYSATELSSITYSVLSLTSPNVVLAQVTGVLTANTTITNAQMLAGIYGTPVQIAPAPGANKAIVVANATISIVYNSIQFQNGGAIRLQYGNTVHAGGTNAMATTVAAADVNNATANNFQILLGIAQAWGLNTTLGNLGIFISCATGEFTNGDSSLKVSMNYRIANLT